MGGRSALCKLQVRLPKIAEAFKIYQDQTFTTGVAAAHHSKIEEDIAALGEDICVAKDALMEVQAKDVDLLEEARFKEDWLRVIVMHEGRKYARAKDVYVKNTLQVEAIAFVGGNLKGLHVTICSNPDDVHDAIAATMREEERHASRSSC